MPNPIRPTPAFIPGLLVTVALAGAVVAPPARALQDTQSKAEQTEAKQKLADLRSKMEALAKQQADNAARRDSANAELARQANALAGAARAVHQTDTELTAKQQQLDQLNQQRTTLK